VKPAPSDDTRKRRPRQRSATAANVHAHSLRYAIEAPWKCALWIKIRKRCTNEGLQMEATFAVQSQCARRQTS